MEQEKPEKPLETTTGAKKTNRSNNFTMLVYVLGVFITLGVGLLVILMRSKAY